MVFRFPTPLYYLSFVSLCHRPCQEDPLNVLDMFAAMQFGDEDRAWDAEADLRRVVRYVRGSKRLVIPQTWRPVIPTEL